jgi:membrane-bound ClpP family serine protease
LNPHERGHERQRNDKRGKVVCVIILGIILLILGLIVGSSILWVIGLVLVLVGALLWLLGSMDRAIGGRRHWY